MCTRLSKIWAGLGVCMLLSCNASRYSEDTVQFNNYLKTYVHTEIARDSMYYVVIAENGCEGCIGKTVTKLKDNKKTLFILNENSYHKYLEPKNVAPERYLIDSTDMIRRLKFHQHNLGILQTANGQIYNILYVLYNDADSTLATLN